MKIWLQIAGAIQILLGLIHILFPWYFNWKKELPKLNLINKQMMEVHTFYVALTVLLLGLLSVFYADELFKEALGEAVTSGIGLFWAIRLVLQFVWYSPKLWKGKPFETAVHFMFIGIWSLLSWVYLIA